MFLKKIIFFSLLITIMSCEEIARMRAENEREKRERGYECTYINGQLDDCDYILPKR